MCWTTPCRRQKTKISNSYCVVFFVLFVFVFSLMCGGV
jgi:hypothetical protein